VDTLKNTLRIEHAQQYIIPPIPNLAIGKPCNASSVDSPDRACSLAFDGDILTRWSSSYTDDNWISVDLGSNTKISKVVLYWESAYAKAFQIQTSTDGKSWTTQYQNENGTGGMNTIPLNNNVVARYVKLYAYARASVWGYSLWEIQLF